MSGELEPEGRTGSCQVSLHCCAPLPQHTHTNNRMCYKCRNVSFHSLRPKLWICYMLKKWRTLHKSSRTHCFSLNTGTLPQRLGAPPTIVAPACLCMASLVLFPSSGLRCVWWSKSASALISTAVHICSVAARVSLLFDCEPECLSSLSYGKQRSNGWLLFFQVASLMAKTVVQKANVMSANATEAEWWHVEGSWF